MTIGAKLLTTTMLEMNAEKCILITTNNNFTLELKLENLWEGMHVYTTEHEWSNVTQCILY